MEVAERRDHLDAEHEAAAELARLGEPRLERGDLVEGGELVEHDLDAACVVVVEREHGVDRDLEPGGDEAPQARY